MGKARDLVTSLPFARFGTGSMTWIIGPSAPTRQPAQALAVEGVDVAPGRGAGPSTVVTPRRCLETAYGAQGAFVHGLDGCTNQLGSDFALVLPGQTHFCPKRWPADRRIDTTSGERGLAQMA